MSYKDSKQGVVCVRACVCVSVCVSTMHLTLFDINIGGQVSQKGVQGRTDWSQTMNLYSYRYTTISFSFKYKLEIKTETKIGREKKQERQQG